MSTDKKDQSVYLDYDYCNSCEKVLDWDKIEMYKCGVCNKPHLCQHCKEQYKMCKNCYDNDGISNQQLLDYFFQHSKLTKQEIIKIIKDEQPSIHDNNDDDFIFISSDSDSDVYQYPSGDDSTFILDEED